MVAAACLPVLPVKSLITGSSRYLVNREREAKDTFPDGAKTIAERAEGG